MAKTLWGGDTGLPKISGPGGIDPKYKRFRADPGRIKPNDPRIWVGPGGEHRIGGAGGIVSPAVPKIIPDIFVGPGGENPTVTGSGGAIGSTLGASLASIIASIPGLVWVAIIAVAGILLLKGRR